MIFSSRVDGKAESVVLGDWEVGIVSSAGTGDMHAILEGILSVFPTILPSVSRVGDERAAPSRHLCCYVSSQLSFIIFVRTSPRRGRWENLPEMQNVHEENTKVLGVG